MKRIGLSRFLGTVLNAAVLSGLVSIGLFSCKGAEAPAPTQAPVTTSGPSPRSTEPEAAGIEEPLIGNAKVDEPQVEKPPAAQAPSEQAPVAPPQPPPVEALAADVDAQPPSGTPELNAWAPVPEFAGTRVAVISTGNVAGDVDPCGCTHNPQGGLGRKAGWLQSYKGRWDAVVLVDIGDLFHDRILIEDGDRDLVLDRAQVYLDIFATLGHDAQGIGDRDLALGPETLLELSRKAQFPFLAANLLRADTGALLLQDHVVLDKAGVKVGIFGLTHAGERDAGWAASQNLRVADPVETARRQVEALQGKGAQVIVALAHLPLESLSELANAVPGLHVVAGSDSQRLLEVPERAGTTWITDAYSQGKYLAITSLFVREGQKKPVFSDPNRRRTLEDLKRSLTERLTLRENALARAKEAGSAGEPSNNVAWLSQNVAKLRAELQQAEMDLEEVGTVNLSDESFAMWDLVSMGPEVAESADITKVVEQLKTRQPRLAKRPEEVPADPSAPAAAE